MLIDTHAHLDLLEEEGLPVAQAVLRARDAGVEAIVTIGIDVPSSRRAVEIARRNENVYAAIGVHPHGSEGYDTSAERELRAMAAEPRVVAVGEIGLDYYHDRSPRERQRAAFRHQLELAIDLGLPICVHSRDASEDVLRILEGQRLKPKGILMHCFDGDGSLAERMLGLGCRISLAGPVTFKNAAKAASIAGSIPLERLLLETDSPYLAPHPHRGTRNEPALLPLIGRRIAELRGVPVEEVARATTGNARRFFGLE